MVGRVPHRRSVPLRYVALLVASIRAVAPRAGIVVEVSPGTILPLLLLLHPVPAEGYYAPFTLRIMMSVAS